MQDDDKIDLDDFDDFDELEDFDDFEDDVSYDEDENLSEFDDVLGEGDSTEGGDDAAIMSGKKESIFSKFSFNQIVILGAIMLGGVVLMFQLMTSEPEPTQENFVSSLNMSGTGDNVVFGEETSEAVLANPEAPQLTNSQGENVGLLNDANSLDSLEIDFDEQVPMPVPISTEGQMDDEETLMQGFEGSNPVEDAVEIASEFESASQRPEMNIPTGFDGGILDSIDGDGNLDLQDQNALEEMPVVPSSLNSLEITPADADETAVIATAISQEKALPMADQVEEPSTTQRISAQPFNKVDRMQDAKDKPAAEMPKREAVNDEAEDFSAKAKMLQVQLNKITTEKDKQIASLRSTVEDLQSQIKAMQKTKVESTPVKKAPVKKTAVKKKAPAKTKAAPKSKTVQWELRAAQPGKAWVAQKGRDDLQPVIVGDTLSGLGRITSISYVNNGWIVTGQKGSIKQ